MISASKTRLLFAGAAFFTFASSAFALDGADVLAKLNAAYAQSGANLSAKEVKVDGDTIVLSGATFKPKNGPAEGVKIGDITMAGVEEGDDGTYNVETVTFPDVDATDKETKITVKDITIEGLYIPSDPAAEGLDGSLLYDSAHTGPISIAVKGKEVFKVASVESTMEFPEDAVAVNFTTAITGLTADLSDNADPKSKDVIEKLNLNTISGDIAFNGNWNLDTGALEVSELSLDFKDIGKLAADIAISGYTKDFVKALQETMKADTSKPDASAAQGMAMMGLMQQLSFQKANIRFDDASITKRLLDYFGAEQKMTGDEMAKSLQGLIPIMMAQANMPDLQNQVVEASNAYLADPKNLTVSAQPAAPVPFPQIMGAAMGAPNTIPAMLGVKVTANQ
jgi:hypothetical protein